jgi:hypothetical protein
MMTRADRRRTFCGCPTGVRCEGTRASTFGLYTVSVRAEGEGRSWRLIVHDAEGRPVAATVQCHCGAPRAQRFFAAAGVSSASDAGVVLDGVAPEPGEWWVVRVTIDGPCGTDSATLNIVTP